MKKLLTTLVGIGIIGLTGCSPNIIKGNYESYSVKIGIPDPYYHKILEIYSKQKDGGNIFFRDYNDDGRFDEIKLNINQGDPIEKFVSFEIAEKIYDELKNNRK